METSPIILQLQRASHGPHFKAFGLRGRDVAQAADPYLNIDHAWMSAPTFPPHPHAGFSAISYVFADSATGLRNRDSLGTHNLIRPGGLHWTAAGSGVVHEEVPADVGKTVHALQIFVMLPPEKRSAPAHILGLEPEQVPTVTLTGAIVRVPFGAFREVRSPLTPPNDVGMFDVTLNEGRELNVPVPAGHVALVMPVKGNLQIQGRPFGLEDARLPVFPATSSDTELTLIAEGASAQAVVFTGRPLQPARH